MPDLAQQFDLRRWDEGEAALAATLRWLSRPPWPRAALSDGAIGSYGDLARSLGHALAAEGLTAWADRLAALAEEASEGGSQWADDAVTALLDEAGLQVALRASHPQTFNVVEDLWEMSPNAARDPVERLIHRLAGAPDDNPLLTRLAGRIAEIAAGETARAGQPIAMPSTRDLWPGPYEIPVEPRWPCHAISRRWPERFMAMLQRVPPPVAHAAILAAGPLDLSAIEMLLRSTAADADPENQASPAAVYALLAQATAAIADLVRAADEAAVTEAVTGLTAALSRRADWPLLSRAWLQQLVWHSRTGRRQPSDDASAALAASDLVIRALAGSAPSMAGVQDWIMAEEALWQVDRVVAEAAILTARGDHEAAGQLLAKAVLTRQATSTARDQALLTGTPEARIVGAAIANLAEPVAWFATLWAESFEARERCWLGAAGAHESPADPALAWGLAGLNNVAEPAAKTRLWHVLCDAMIERILTDPQGDLPSDLRDKILRTAFFLGTHFQTAGMLKDQDIMRLLTPLIAPTPRFLGIVEIILAAGGEPLLHRFAAGAGGERICAALATALSSLATEPAAAQWVKGESIESLRELLEVLRP